MNDQQHPDSHFTPQRKTRLDLLAQANLYLCTDIRTAQGDFASFVEAAYRGGVDIIQLRDKSIDAAAEIAAAHVLGDIARRMGKLFAINDRADVAALVHADVLHVGQADLTPEQARKIVGPDMLIGRSNRDAAMFEASITDPDVDYAVIGPVWDTATHPDRPAVGLQRVKDAVQIAGQLAKQGHPKSWWTIGGIELSRIPELKQAGGRRAAVVRAITLADDPEHAARELKQALAG